MYADGSLHCPPEIRVALHSKRNVYADGSTHWPLVQPSNRIFLTQGYKQVAIYHTKVMCSLSGVTAHLTHPHSISGRGS